jgi:hypothetical protein
MTSSLRTAVPLFEQYSIEDLARLAGYSEVYLVALKNQPERIRPRFRKTIAAILGRTEAELFERSLGSEAATTNDVGPTSPHGGDLGGNGAEPTPTAGAAS